MSHQQVWEASAALRAAGRRLNESEEDRPAAAAGSRLREATAAVPAWAVPPVGNTGGKLTSGLTVKLDWLNVTFPTHQREAVQWLTQS